MKIWRRNDPQNVVFGINASNIMPKNLQNLAAKKYFQGEGFLKIS